MSRYRPERNDWGGVLLEITGRQFVSKGTALMPLLNKLKEAGIPIAVDNFGVGAVYFDVFNQVRCAEIKIDRSLIEGCASDSGKKRTCKSIIQMAHNFDALAVAVGVSNEADLKTLAELDCDLAQGFLFGKPMTVGEIDSLIAKSRLGTQGSVSN